MKDTKEKLIPQTSLFPREKRGLRPVEGFPLSLSNILIRSIGFLVSRATPIPGIFPFGLAFLTIERTFSAKSLFTLLMVLSGYASLGTWQSFPYICACIVFEGVLLFSEHTKELSQKATLILTVSVTAFFHAVTLLWDGLAPISLLLFLLNLSFLGMGVLAFDRCHTLLSRKNFRSGLFTVEERLSLCVLTGIVLLSFQNFPASDWLSLANILGFLLLGMIAISNGLPASTIAGLIIGFLLGFQTELLSCLAVFGFCGLTCGLCNRFRKHGVAAALALSGLLLSSYAYGNGIPAIHYPEAPLGAILLLLIPPSAFRELHRFLEFSPVSAKEDVTYKTHLQSRLVSAADSFQTLAETFVRISDKQDRTDIQDIALLLDTAADHVCRHCSRVQDCWNRNFNSTYKTMFQLLEKLERKGILQPEDASPYFSGRCLHLSPLLKEMNRLFEIHKINQIWKGKLCENRTLIGEQFHGIAEILTRLSTELDDAMTLDCLAAQEIRCRLEKQHILTETVQVLQLPNGRQMVEITLKNHAESKQGIILSILKNILGKNFSITETGNSSMLQFCEVPEFFIDAAVAAAGREGECGDSHALHLLHGGKYIATLSDGMGTGYRASRESSATLALLEAFMDAGFDKTVAVKLINSVMVMKSANEAFATVDMCMIDLYTGETEFIKNGAEPSYIKRRYITETVRSASLPVGVLSGVEAETFAHRLDCGDTVVMISDGLALREGREDWLRQMLEQTPPDLSSQTLADRIMARSLELKGGVADDDMTVLVLRLLKTL